MNDEPISKGDHLTLWVTSWGRLGEAMARYQGQDVFIFGGIPGEQVIAEIVRIYRKHVAARVIRVLHPSPHRVEPPCPYYGECTGCQWQHIDYDYQLLTKQEMVTDALVRIGGFPHPLVSPVLASPNHYGYRNHARFTVGAHGALGFVNRETRRFVRIDKCMLMHDGINHLLAQLQDNCGETTQVAIRAGDDTGEFLIQPTLTPATTPVPTGQKHYVDSVSGRRFRVASPSFFQVNVAQTAQLSQVVRSALDLQKNEILLDAYAGVGTFAVLLSPWVGKVIAIEESAAAIEDAKENIAGLNNVELIIGKTEEILPTLKEKPDAVILDPPRSGCQSTALQSLTELAPAKVAYVSCNAETLARDLKFLCDGHYKLEDVKTLDMFPQTHHVECVAILTLQTSDGQITLASASPRRQELLATLGLTFKVKPANVNEEPRADEPAQDMVRRLAWTKAMAVVPKIDQGFVIGADTVVILNNRILGKPRDQIEAKQMLQDLRGTHHHVTTGLTVVNIASGRSLTETVTSEINLRNFSDHEIDTFIVSGVPLDKAGAYAIQDLAFHPAESMTGCYSNIVGLPLCRLLEMLKELGCPLPPQSSLSIPSSCENCQGNKRSKP